MSYKTRLTSLNKPVYRILVTAVFALLFLLTGSLWLPMILHAAVDILQGRAAYEIMRRSDNATLVKKDNGEAIAANES